MERKEEQQNKNFSEELKAYLIIQKVKMFYCIL